MSHDASLLHRYLKANDIPSALVEREARVTRQQMYRWRLRGADIRRKNMVRVLGAVRKISGKNVRMEELFDLDPDNPANWN